MKRRTKTRSPRWMQMDRRVEAPLYRQIYDRTRNAIVTGTLRPGERLPSARSLASQLAAARGTIDHAYSLLANEGYIDCRGAAGTFVSTTLLHLARLRPPILRVSGTATVRPAFRTEIEHVPLPLQPGLPAMDAFPLKLWSQLAARRARNMSTEFLMYPNYLGYAPLRKTIAGYLAVARGITCVPEQIVITNGFLSALGLITRILMKQNDAVWMEDPGHYRTREALIAAGAAIEPIPVDELGINVDIGMTRSPRARLALVTPAHQAPLGMALDLSRRLSLLAWAKEAQAWILENDYDGEFRYQSKPMPALKSLDREGRVLYMGSFSKVLFPGLRLGYLVLPEFLVEPFTRALNFLYRDGSIFLQAVVCDFMAEGHFARHVRRMRQLYAERRAALAEALTETFGDRFDIKLRAGGMYLLAQIKNRELDTALVAKARSQGFGPVALSNWNVQSNCGQGILIGFTNTPARSARTQIRRLEQAWN